GVPPSGGIRSPKMAEAGTSTRGIPTPRLSPAFRRNSINKDRLKPGLRPHSVRACLRESPEPRRGPIQPGPGRRFRRGVPDRLGPSLPLLGFRRAIGLLQQGCIMLAHLGQIKVLCGIAPLVDRDRAPVESFGLSKLPLPDADPG